MKKHTTEQIIRKLREAEVLASQGRGVAEICQALEVIAATSIVAPRERSRCSRCTYSSVARIRALLLGAIPREAGGHISR